MKRHILTYSARELIPYINWDYFFHAWGIAPHQKSEPLAMQLQQEAIALITDSNCKITFATKILFY